MPLHLTKVAFGVTSLEHLATRLRERGEEGPVFLTTRYLPKRHAEIAWAGRAEDKDGSKDAGAKDAGAKDADRAAGGGSLYWIFRHMLVARSPILGFGDAEAGKVAIHIAPGLIATEGRPKRAHQGWRYLEPGDAPADLAGGDAGEAMPTALTGRLMALGLL